MKTNIRLVLILFICSLVSVTGSCQSDTTKPLPKPIGYINDFEHIYTPEQMASLDSLVKAYEKQTTTEFAIVTLDSSYTSRDSFDIYAIRLAMQWKVGKKDKNNGVTVAISKNFRRMRIVLGIGIEKVLSDGDTRKMIDIFFVPEFRQGNYYEGTFKGIDALMQVLAKKEEK